MRFNQSVIVGGLFALMFAVAAACGDDSTSTPAATATGTATTAPTSTTTASATATSTATETGTAAPTGTAPVDDAERAALIAQFPAEVQPLLEPLWSTKLIALLLEVRNMGADTLVWQDAGGEFNEGMKRAFLNEWEQITGWTINSVSLAGEANNLLEEQVKAGKPS